MITHGKLAIAQALERCRARGCALDTLQDVQRQIVATDPLDAAFPAPGVVSLGGYARADTNRRRLLLHRAALRAEIRRLSAELRAMYR